MNYKKLRKNRIRTIQAKALKQNQRFKNFTNYQNRYKRRRQKRYKRNRTSNSRDIFDNLKRERIIIPAIFSISIDIEAVLSLIYRTKKLLENSRTKLFDFDFSQVKQVDDGAATILLSLCHDIDNQNKLVRSNLPADPEARKYMQQIGFRKFFKGYIPTKEGLNETIKKGRAKILQKETVPIIHKAMKTVFGEDKKNQSLQGMLIELMTNSVNHAYLANNRQKSWYISTRHDTINKKVEFCFVDNGDGIINTINVRLLQKLTISNDEIIERAFNGEFRSRTKQKNRGRGLIVIKKNHNKMTITGLKVITNSVLLDFETGVTTKLNTPFSGTFYSWILDKTCK